MPHDILRILMAVQCTPWALDEERLLEIIAVLERRNVEGPLPADEVEARLMGGRPGHDQEREAAAAPRRTTQGSVAVLPLFGVISNRIHMVRGMSGPGGTSAEAFANQVRGAAANPNIKAIVIDVDSPGGTVPGVAEAAAAVFRAREQKHVVAMVNSEAHSAAYWIASQADKISVTPSGSMGAIGVRTAHVDMSAALEARGEKVTVISAGKYKSELLPFGPLSDEAHAALQARVDESHGQFIDAVARGRDVKSAEVRNGFGQGRSLPASEAVRAGMADRIEEMGELLTRLGVSPQHDRAAESAEAEPAPAAMSLERGRLALGRARLTGHRG